LPIIYYNRGHKRQGNNKENKMAIDYERHGDNENADKEDEWNTNWQDDADEVEHIQNSRHIRLK